MVHVAMRVVSMHGSYVCSILTITDLWTQTVVLGRYLPKKDVVRGQVSSAVRGFNSDFLS